MLGLLGIGIGLQRQQAAIGADQLVFVKMARTQAGHENLPETAGVPPPHRHAPAVPAVEVADDADPLRVRRPDRERHPLDALMHDRVRAELLIAREMVALDQQMQVEFAEHRPEAVDVGEFLLVSAPPDAQPVAEHLAAIGHAGDEHTSRMNALGARGDLAGRAFDDRDALGVGQKRANVDAGRALMHAEKGERIAVAGVDDRLDLGAGTIRHSLSRLAVPARLGEHAKDSGKRDRHPVRPVGQLVIDFVNRLFEREKFDQCLSLQFVGGIAPASRASPCDRRRASRRRRAPARSRPARRRAAMRRDGFRRSAAPPRWRRNRTSGSSRRHRAAANSCAGAAPSGRDGSPSKSMM